MSLPFVALLCCSFLSVIYCQCLFIFVLSWPKTMLGFVHLCYSFGHFHDTQWIWPFLSLSSLLFFSFFVYSVLFIYFYLVPLLGNVCSIQCRIAMINLVFMWWGVQGVHTSTHTTHTRCTHTDYSSEQAGEQRQVTDSWGRLGKDLCWPINNLVNLLPTYILI